MRKKAAVERRIERKIRKNQLSLLREWNPEIATVTVVAIILILGITSLSAIAIEGLKKEVSALGSAAAGSQAGAANVTGVSYDLLAALADASGGTLLLAEPKDCTITPGKVSILAFHSPTCPGCALQSPVLAQVLEENAAGVAAQKACIATHSAGDYLSCSRDFAQGADTASALAYICGNDSGCIGEIMNAACADWNISACEQTALRSAISKMQKERGYTIYGAEAMSLSQQFAIRYTPTVVFNCYFKREGSLERAYELRLLEDIIKAFKAA